MSIRSVDMQHTLQQVAAAERVQAVDRGQAEQEAGKFAQRLERTEAQRRHTVRETTQPDQGKVQASNPDEEGRHRRRKRRRDEEERPAATPPVATASDGEIHLIDIRV